MIPAEAPSDDDGQHPALRVHPVADPPGGHAVLLGIVPQAGNAVGIEPAQPAGRAEWSGKPRDYRDGEGQHHTDGGRVLHSRARGLVEEGRDVRGNGRRRDCIENDGSPDGESQCEQEHGQAAAAQTSATLRRRATRTPAVRKISATHGSQLPIETTAR
jgi:hypothetical protein